jgi:WD40 repeat protein
MSVHACPFPGLLPFQEKDAPYFFGREREIAELLHRLDARRFIAVIGVSGSGKSSLVRAGVKPELHLANPAWRIVEIKPGGGPRTGLVANLDAVLPGPRWGELLRSSSYGLIDGIRQADLAPAEKLLIIVDQFEEIFPYRRTGSIEAAEADLFVQQLLRASTEPGVPAYVMLTMRTDYLGHCALFRNLAEALNQGTYLVPRLTRHEQEEAIRLPLAVSGVGIEPGVVDGLLNAAESNRDELPVLQHLLKRLWEEWAARGASGNIGRTDYENTDGWDEAIGKDADAVLEPLTAPEQEAARLVFKRITEKGTGERPIRTPCSFTELAELMRPMVTAERLREVLAAFRLRDLLVWESEQRIDIPHECVTWRWQKLAAWIEEEARDARRLAFIAESARTKTPLAGSALEEARMLRDRVQDAWVRKYNLDAGELRRWIEYSVALAMRARRRTRTVLAATGLAAILFAALGAWAWTQKSQADEQKRLALARLLASRSNSLFAEDPSTLEQATLLAVLSLRQQPTFDADLGLRRRLSLLPRTLFMARVAQSVVTISPDGRRIAVAGPANDARVIDIASGKEVSRLVHGGTVRAVDFGPDGRWVATGSDDGTARVMEATTGKETARLAHGKLVRDVKFSPNGRWVATDSDDGTVRVMEAATGKEVSRWANGEEPGLPSAGAGNILLMAFSADSRRVASAGEKGVARVWDAATGHQAFRVDVVEFLNAVAFSPDGRWLAMAGRGRDRPLRVIDTTNRRELPTMSHPEEVYAMAFSPDSTRLVTGSADGTVRVMEVATGRSGAGRVHQNAVLNVVFSPDGQLLATASHDQTVRVIEMATGNEFVRVGHRGSSWNVAFSANGRSLAIANSPSEKQHEPVVRVIDTGTRDEVFRLEPEAGVLNTVVVSPAADRVAAGGEAVVTTDGSPNGPDLRVMDTSTGKEIWRLRNGTTGVLPVALSHDGTHVATWTRADKAARVIDMATGREVSRFGEAHPRAAAFSPDGRWIAMASGRVVRVIEIASGKEVSTLEDEGDVGAVAFSPDSRLVTIGSGAKTARVVEVATRRELSRLTPPHDEGVWDVAFSPDGKWVATGSRDKTARVMEAATGKELWRFPHPLSVQKVVFSPDSHWVATQGSDNVTRVLEAATGRESSRFEVAASILRNVRFSSDARWLEIAYASGSIFNVVYSRYPFHPEELILQACSTVTRNLTVDEWTQYAGPEVPYERTCENLPFPPDYKPGR